MGTRSHASFKGKFLLPAAGLLLLLLVYSCKQRESRLEQLMGAQHYLNLHDSVQYVGMHACRECHYPIYLSYLKTGMGLSFDTAHRAKSAAVIGPDSMIHDPHSNLTIQPFWKGDSLMVREFRERDGQRVHERVEHVDYVVGSGQHTNSHIFMSGAYAYQAPFTYYTQQGMFDLPPGFEDGHNTRFSRKVGLECMSCHNGYPEMVLGSENKYTRIPDGIDCERCHGPGEIHVMLKKRSILVDTSRFIDYSIVNPAKLPRELQTDLCARCHLQGTMVLREGKSFFDFRPGMRLDDVMDIFMPLFEGGKEDFIMASHYERMVQSRCYRESGDGFTCIDCHNPHVTRQETPDRKYNAVCARCHSSGGSVCTLAPEERARQDNSCVRCHMPSGPSRDIPHVTTHDHRIARPQTPEEINAPRVFKGLVSVNNPATDPLTMARGYLLEYESYHPDPSYLDSAASYLGKAAGEDHPFYFNALVNHHFLKKDDGATVALVERTGIARVLDSLLTETEYSNYDAWTAYRIGQAYENSGNLLVAGYFYEKAVDLAPYILEFRDKHGSLLALTGKYQEATEIFEFILREDPGHVPALVNLGYLQVRRGRLEKGEQLYREALQLDPDHLQALLNLAASLAGRGQAGEANAILEHALQLDPGNMPARELRTRIAQDGRRELFPAQDR